MISSNFTWETAKTLDAGIDLSLFNNRLQATFDWYQRNTTGMLAPGRGPVCRGWYYGTGNRMLPTCRNRGWEITLSWRHQINDWGYRLGFNLYDSKTVITKYDNPNKSLGDGLL